MESGAAAPHQPPSPPGRVSPSAAPQAVVTTATATAAASTPVAASLEVSLGRGGGGGGGSGCRSWASVQSQASFGQFPAPLARGASQMSLGGTPRGGGPGSLLHGQVMSLDASPLNGTACPDDLVAAMGRTRHHAEGDALRTGPTAVIDGELYIGSAKDANDAAACRAAGITAYLCAAGDLAADPLPAHARGGDSGGGGSTAPTLLHLPLRDVATEPLAAHVPIACAFIDAQVAAGGRVLVYCQAGRSRSVSVVVAYVMRRRDINAEAALGDVRARYPRADPNMGFLLQLAELGGNDTCRDDDQGGEGSLLQLCDIGGA